MAPNNHPNAVKIGFYGNANNYPFMLARALRRLGHEVLFLVTSREKLNRPEHRYTDVRHPYPDWLLDVSHPIRWHCLVPGLGRSAVIARLNSCDAVILNEEGPALAGFLTVPHGVLATGSDLEIFANPAHAAMLKPQAFARPRWAGEICRHIIPTSLIRSRLTHPQRAGLRAARFVAFLPQGLAPAADRLLGEIGVTPSQRLETQFTDCEFATYTPPPQNSVLRLFSATRFTYLPGPGLTSLDLKGSETMLRGLAQFLGNNSVPLEIHLVRKGLHVAEAESLAGTLGLTPFIVWHEQMTQHEVLLQFRRADIVFDQLGESALGMAGLDALATGRPIIANGRPEIIGPITGEPSPIFQAHTPEDVRFQLEQLQDSALREQAGRASRDYVLKHFSSDTAAGRIMAKLGIH